MPRKPQKKYGPGGQYYRKRIKGPDGWEDIYGLTLAERDRKVDVRLAEIAALTAPPKPEDMYFYEYAAGWYKRKAPGLKPDEQKRKQYQINKVICPVIGGKLLRDITSDDVAEVMATRAHLGRSAQEKTAAVLRQIFEAAMDAGAIEKLPYRKIKAGGKNGPMPDALTEAQQKALLQTVRGLKVEPGVMLALYAGLRREEFCALTWEHVHLDTVPAYLNVRRVVRWPGNNQPVVDEKELKTTAAWRTIPLPDVLRDYLKDLRAARLSHFLAAVSEEGGPRGRKGKLDPETRQKQAEARLQKSCVYGNEDGSPMSMSSFRKRWDTIRARSTLSGRAMGECSRNHKVVVTLDFYPNPHLLRHTYITRLILGKMDLKRVQYLAGHADPQITIRIYTALMGHAPEDLIDDVNAIFSPPSSPSP